MTTLLTNAGKEYHYQFKKRKIDTSPEEFKEATLKLYDHFSSVERDVIEKALSNSEVSSMQVKYNIIRKIKRLTRDMSLPDNFKKDFKLAYFSVKNHIKDFKTHTQSFKDNPVLDVLKKINTAAMKIDDIFYEIECRYFYVILDNSSFPLFEWLSAFRKGFLHFVGLPTMLIRVVKKSNEVDENVRNYTLEVLEAVLDFIDKIFYISDKTISFDEIRKEEVVIRDRCCKISDDLYREYEYLRDSILKMQSKTS